MVKKKLLYILLGLFCLFCISETGYSNKPSELTETNGYANGRVWKDPQMDLQNKIFLLYGIEQGIGLFAQEASGHGQDDFIVGLAKSLTIKGFKIFRISFTS